MAPNVFSHFQPKCHNEVNDDWTTKGEKGCINEVQPYTTDGKIQTIADGGANTE